MVEITIIYNFNIFVIVVLTKKIGTLLIAHLFVNKPATQQFEMNSIQLY